MHGAYVPNIIVLQTSVILCYVTLSFSLLLKSMTTLWSAAARDRTLLSQSRGSLKCKGDSCSRTVLTYLILLREKATRHITLKIICVYSELERVV